MPVGTNILDNFNRANEDPLAGGANWDGPLYAGFAELKVVSNQAAAAAGDNNFVGSWWDAATFGPDCEVFCTIATLPTVNNRGVHLHLRANSLPDQDGYGCEWRLDTGGNDDIYIYKLTGGGGRSDLATTAVEMSAGVKLLFEAIGTTLTVYTNTGAGWSQQVQTTDSSYTTPGKFALEMNDSQCRVDDFGGQTAARDRMRLQNFEAFSSQT